MKSHFVIIIPAVLIVACGVPKCVLADVAEKYMYLSYQVLDKTGTPVPNVSVSVTAVDEKGHPYSGDTFSAGALTDSNGRGGWGTAGAPEIKPGKAVVIAKHPAIGEVRRTVEWTELLHTDPRVRSNETPMFIFKAEGGPGLAAWRKDAAKEAAKLVEELGKATDVKQVESLTKQIVVQEMMAVPALMQKLQDYKNANRRTFVKSLLWTWNGCRGVGPVDPDILAKAQAVYDVNMSVGGLREKPQIKLGYAARAGMKSLTYSAYVVKEMEWVIPIMRAQAADARKTGNKGEAQILEENAKKMEAELEQVKKAVATMPASAPTASSQPSTMGSADDVLFHETFEDAKLGKRDWYDGDKFRIVGDALAGAGCVEFEWSGDNKLVGSRGARHLFKATDEIYVRYYLKLSRGWGWTHKNYHPHLTHFMTTENEKFAGPAASHLTLYVEPMDGKLRLAAQDIQNKDMPHGLTQGPIKGGYNGMLYDSKDVLFKDDKWHCIEAYFRLNTLDLKNDRPNKDGIVRGWFDGKCVIDKTDAVLRSTDFPKMQFNQFLMLPYFGPGLLPHAQKLWIDDLVVATKRIGPVPEKKSPAATQPS